MVFEADMFCFLSLTMQPPEDKFDDIIGRFTSFHQGFMK
jgi:hypothetical protein